MQFPIPGGPWPSVPQPTTPVHNNYDVDSLNLKTQLMFQSLPSVVVANAVCNGANDDTQALIDAVNSLPPIGGTIICPPGRMRLVGSMALLSAAINTKQFVRFYGLGQMGWRGTNSTPNSMMPSILFCKEITGYTIDITPGTALQSLVLQGLAFDGSNGAGNVGASTTWQGLLACNKQILNFFNMSDCSVNDTKFAHSSGTSGSSGRAILDLDGGNAFNLIERCQIANAVNGRLVFADGGGTTLTFRKVYFASAREIRYIRNHLGAHFEDCVFESSVVDGAQYLSSVMDTMCHYENLGQNNGGAAWVDGITPRNHGLVFGGGILSGTINTAYNGLYGTHVRMFPWFAGILDTGPYNRWFEFLGTGNVQGAGGTLAILYPRKGDDTLTEFLFSDTMAFTATERAGSGLAVHIEDAWGESPVGAAIQKCDDARKCNSGRFRPNMNDGSYYLATIKRGRFWYELQDPATSMTGALLIWPRNVQNEIGDVVILPAPVAGGSIGFVCTTAGQPGTWKSFGAIAP